MASILILDPSPDRRTVLQLLVLLYGHRPVALPEDADAVVLDPNDVAGVRTTRALRRGDPRLPVIVLGTSAPAEIEATAFVLEPLRPSELRRALAAALAGRPEVHVVAPRRADA